MEVKMKRILYIITLANLGGAQVHLFDLISSLPKHIISYVAIGEKGWLYDQLKKQGVIVYNVESLVRQIAPIHDVKAVLQLNQIIKDVRPDIIHCHSSKAGFLGRISAKMCGVPTVFTAHGWAFTEGVSTKKRLLYKTLEKLAAKWTTKIICVSEYDRNLGLTAIADGADKLVIIHNGVVEFGEEIRKRSSANCERLRLIMVARFSSPKDHALLLKAVVMLRRENIRMTITLVGDGPNLEASKILASELGISEDVYFAGAKSDVNKILVDHDVFVLISNWEGFPISIIEGMRQGLPVVASDVGGVNEAVIDGETGFLIPRGDTDTLVARLRELHQNKELRKVMGHKGRKRFEEYFTINIMTSKTVDVYRNVMDKN
jgi:glycosyltransferase involved in cell wall biosynthesis